jgi:hypothetical protein
MKHIHPTGVVKPSGVFSARPGSLEGGNDRPVDNTPQADKKLAKAIVFW